MCGNDTVVLYDVKLVAVDHILVQTAKVTDRRVNSRKLNLLRSSYIVHELTVRSNLVGKNGLYYDYVWVFV